MVGNEQIDLDKDILCKGNKVYSPETCVFVPHTINTLFLRCQKNRGNLSIGVCFDKSKKKYCAGLGINNKNIKLGVYNTPEEAFAEYKRHKEALIVVTADKYKGRIPEKLYKAMIASVYRGQHASTHVISRVFSVIFNRRTSLYASFIFLENP
jgi:hypothetical protein